MPASSPVPVAERRAHERVSGPFDGRRLGALDTPVVICNLSEGGCFISATHEQRSGVVFDLEIDLPYVRMVTVTAEALYHTAFGFGARFIAVNGTNAGLLRDSLNAVKQHGY